MTIYRLCGITALPSTTTITAITGITGYDDAELLRESDVNPQKRSEAAETRNLGMQDWGRSHSLHVPSKDCFRNFNKRIGA
ncbi:hypothetical protein [Rhizobium laguerreae]|uniref:Uncharacterized protein n=1 Tax=Rhizobium laguerreae TaxID=1076926 RepID=A0A7Y2RBP4_9HYPH|nr:hypothetical protein [Rhizobium laguerreae]NNH67992.1 hypothetical protein [Rhizobium laguerreae]